MQWGKAIPSRNGVRDDIVTGVTVLLEFRFGEEAQVAAFFGHHGLEARKVVAHVGVEQIIALEDDAVVGERK